MKKFYWDMILILSSEGTCFLFDARRKWFPTSPIYLNIACIFVNLRISFLALENYCTGCGNCFKGLRGWFALKNLEVVMFIKNSLQFVKIFFIETWFYSFPQRELVFVWCMKKVIFNSYLFKHCSISTDLRISFFVFAELLYWMWKLF